MQGRRRPGAFLIWHLDQVKCKFSLHFNLFLKLLLCDYSNLRLCTNMDKIYEQSLYCEHLFEEMSLIVKLLKVIKVSSC